MVITTSSLSTLNRFPELNTFTQITTYITGHYFTQDKSSNHEAFKIHLLGSEKDNFGEFLEEDF